LTPRKRLKSPRLRLFVAVDLPPTVRAPLITWRQEALGDVPELRLLSHESLHVTLVFLGYQAERDVERIAEICFSGEAGPFELRAEKLVGVPPRRPRLYALALEDRGGALAGWQASLSTALARAGLYEPEKRPFWSHVTLARSKRDRPAPRIEAAPALPEELDSPFSAERATLYKSTLTPRGAVYEPLAETELSRGEYTP
jgi:RNA 2',3'-cyclic 3'-phosphodiesterase